jgi:hypothetical protein
MVAAPPIDTDDVYTYYVFMNLTLSVDDKLVEKARQVASRQGTSLQALVRQYIETLAGSREGAALVDRLEQHWGEADRHLRLHPAKRYKFDRNELYEDRVGRRPRGQ